MYLPSILITTLLAATTLAHPGHDIEKEAAERREVLLNNRNNLNHCAGKFQERGLHQRAIERRAELAAKLSKHPNLQGTICNLWSQAGYSSTTFIVLTYSVGRQVSPLSKNHKSSKVYTVETSPSVIFAGNNSCILNPEATEGPFCKTPIVSMVLLE
jgi:hypothetical protein